MPPARHASSSSKVCFGILLRGVKTGILQKHHAVGVVYDTLNGNISVLYLGGYLLEWENAGAFGMRFLHQEITKRKIHHHYLSILERTTKEIIAQQHKTSIHDEEN
jgi:hypothetical protein